MSYITTLSQKSAVQFVTSRGNSGASIFRLDQSFGAKRIWLPLNVSGLNTRPSGGNYGNRQYLVGGHTANLVIDEELRCNRQGIGPPDKAPTVSVGAGSISQVCYTRFYDELTGERSPLSSGKAVTGDINRVWTDLPTEVPRERITIEGIADISAGVVTGVGAPAKTNFLELRPGDRIAKSSDLTRWAQIRTISSMTSMTIDDSGLSAVSAVLIARPYSRASHIELWVSVSGGLPRVAIRARLGTTAITESVATLALGQAEVTSFTAMPRGGFSVLFNDRQFVAGVDGHLNSIYASAAGFPERHEGLIFKTTYNEPVVGLLRFPSYILVLCPDSSYTIRGYTDEDYVMTTLWPDIGGLGHHGNLVVNNVAYIPGRKGIQLFNGAFHQGIPTRQTEWSDDYAASVVPFEEGFAVLNANDQTYQFFPGFVTLPSSTVSPLQNFVYVAHYDKVGPVAGGTIATPEWLSDTMGLGSGHVSAAAYLVPSGSKVGKLYKGNTDGLIYEEDETNTVNAGVSIIVTPHYLMGDVGGSRREGKALIRLWSYVESEIRSWEVRVWPGDERAYPLSDPMWSGPFVALAQWTDTRAASALTDYAPQTVHPHMNMPKLAGRGWTFEYRLNGGRGVKFYGLGGIWGPGEVARRKVDDPGGG